MVMVNRHHYLFFFFWLLPFGGERRYLPYTPVYPYMHIYIHTYIVACLLACCCGGTIYVCRRMDEWMDEWNIIKRRADSLSARHGFIPLDIFFVLL